MPRNESVILVDADYSEASMDSAVEKIFNFSGLNFAGSVVLVKPNIAAQCEIKKAATTHPSLVRAVVKALEQRGAKRIMVGDNPGPTAYGINERCARVTGILEAAGGCYVNLKRRPMYIDLNSDMAGSVQVSSEFFECDYVINLPKLKSHCHAYLTASVKNMYGMLVGGEKARLHVIGTDPEKFANILVDVFCARMPDLNIVDAVICMEGNGPTNGSPKFVGKIAAGVNGFALDAVCARMVGFNISRIKTLVVAKERRLWSGDPDSIEIHGEIPEGIKFKRPLTFGAFGVFSTYMMPFVANIPVIQRSKCRKCGLCVKQCPVHACTPGGDGYPQIDSVLCIRCYCCQEFCPHDAISLTGFMFRLTGILAGTAGIKIMGLFSRKWRRRWAQMQRTIKLRSRWKRPRGR